MPRKPEKWFENQTLLYFPFLHSFDDSVIKCDPEFMPIGTKMGSYHGNAKIALKIEI